MKDESLSDKINELVGSWEGLLTFDKMRLKEEILQILKESTKELKDVIQKDILFGSIKEELDLLEKIDKIFGSALI